MGLKERIQELCKRDNVSMNKVETDLGFGKGYISKLGKSTPNTTKIQKLADYFNVSTDYLVTGEDKSGLSDRKYYTNDETAEMADKIFHNKELRLLFDAASDAEPEDLETVHQMLLALKRKERGGSD